MTQTNKETKSGTCVLRNIINLYWNQTSFTRIRNEDLDHIKNQKTPYHL